MAIPPEQVKNQQELDDENDAEVATELEKLIDEKLENAVANREGLVTISFLYDSEPTSAQSLIVANRYTSKGWADLKISYSGKGALLVCLQKKLLHKS